MHGCHILFHTIAECRVFTQEGIGYHFFREVPSVIHCTFQCHFMMDYINIYSYKRSHRWSTDWQQRLCLPHYSLPDCRSCHVQCTWWTKVVSFGFISKHFAFSNSKKQDMATEVLLTIKPKNLTLGKPLFCQFIPDRPTRLSDSLVTFLIVS